MLQNILQFYFNLYIKKPLHSKTNYLYKKPITTTIYTESMKNKFSPFIILLVCVCTPFVACKKQSLTLDEIKLSVADSGMIYTNAPFPSCHASTVLSTENGILAAWFGGTHERHPDVCIYLSALQENKDWSTPMLVADGIVNDTLRYPCWNPVLYELDNKDIVLFYKVGPSPQEWWGMCKLSKDGGTTWGEAVELPKGFLGPIKNKAVRLSDGTILCPSSNETLKEEWTAFVETVDQSLTNWNKYELDNDTMNAIQPTILFHPNHTLQMLCRTRNRVVAQSWSVDNGKTWTQLQPSNLPNNNSGVDAVTLPNGIHLLIYNPLLGIDYSRDRNKLSIAASIDGIEWKDVISLEDLPEGEFSYPAIIADATGTIYVTYTYNRKQIKYAKLTLSEQHVDI